MKNIKYFFLALLFTSCLGSKKIFEKKDKTKETDKTEIIKDSTSNTVVSEAIKDRIVINVPETDNKEVMAMFEVLLQRMNTSKSSGDNSYKMRYDEQTRELIAEISVAASKIEKSSTNSDSKIEKTFEQEIDSFISKKIKIIPWWIYAIGAFFFRAQIFSFISFFFPALKRIKSAGDLLK